MKFWVIETTGGETIGCELTRKAALAYVESRGYDHEEVEVVSIECAITADTIRRLLGNLGGYAK